MKKLLKLLVISISFLLPHLSDAQQVKLTKREVLNQFVLAGLKQHQKVDSDFDSLAFAYEFSWDAKIHAYINPANMDIIMIRGNTNGYSIILIAQNIETYEYYSLLFPDEEPYSKTMFNEYFLDLYKYRFGPIAIGKNLEDKSMIIMKVFVENYGLNNDSDRIIFQ